MIIPILLIGAAIILGLWAQMRVSSMYNKWSQVRSHSGITGREAARYVMEKAGIHDVEIVPCQGKLTDHYDPQNKRLALSEGNYNGSSLAALGVAAHEAGHAIQHKVGYAPLNLRMSLIPITQFASQLLPVVMLGGFFFMAGAFKSILFIGALCYLVLTIFQLVTLPVEFDASRRAKRELLDLGIIQSNEKEGVLGTLNAAGWTYVAAFVTSLAWFLYLFMAARE